MTRAIELQALAWFAPLGWPVQSGGTPTALVLAAAIAAACTVLYTQRAGRRSARDEDR